MLVHGRRCRDIWRIWDGMEWDGIGVRTRRAGCGSLAALMEEEMVGTDIAHRERFPPHPYHLSDCCCVVHGSEGDVSGYS